MATGEMVVLTASIDDIDTTEQLMAFEAYQKLCVVNGTNKKIADFTNSSTTFNAGYAAYPLKGDTLTQAGTGAKMLVDSIDSGLKIIYGFRITTAAFDTNGAVSSDDVGGTTMDPASYTPDAVTDRTDGPLWYDWVTHPSKTFDLPDEVTIGCLYRGRAVLSGNPNSPFQWYMSRQGDIFDYDYAAGDAQTAVKGGNSNMGEIGDIVRALIPYKDDYLIFGCATTIWYAADDPAYGGTLNSLDLSTGMYGPFSWCFGPKDENGNSSLYFWGTNGLYTSTIPGAPVCISQMRLPDLVKDEAADPRSHRISLGFDRRNNGINVFITHLSSGTNSNWFYDLSTEGFFPESYPNQCTVYSSFYYPANNPEDKDLLVGSLDGYIRRFDRNTKSDDIGASDKAIDSYVTLEPYPMSKDLDRTGKLTAYNLMSSGGPQADFDDIYFKVYTDLTPEGVIKKMMANGIPRAGGTFVAPGRRSNNRRMHKIDGAYLGIKLGSNTIAQSWSFEKFYGTIKPSGRIK